MVKLRSHRSWDHDVIWLSEEFEGVHVKLLASSRWLLYRYNFFLLTIPLHSSFLLSVCFAYLFFICWVYLLLTILHRGIVKQEELAPLPDT